MGNGEKVATKMRYPKHIDCSDIPEIKDFSKGHLRNYQQFAEIKKALHDNTPYSSVIDTDNFFWLKANDKLTFQKRVNDTLRWAKENGYVFEED